ncbi:phage tail protein, partial [Yersinia mollaretii]|uniref:phage tail protein n=1 Tax=Yersinia mollaretii TaxID=33060 RepID=UPI000AADBF52
MKNIMPPINTPDNAFHDGNPATGEQGTIVPGLWLNNSQGAIRNIQQELISVLTEAGIEIDESENNQLLASILKLIIDKTPDLPVATLLIQGIVKLSNATNSTSETVAATSKAVRAVDIAALKIVNNLSEIAAAGTAAVADALKNLTLTDMGIGLPSMTATANFDWQNFVFTSGANYLTAYNTWLNPPAGVTYTAGTAVSITVDNISSSQVGLTLIPLTVSNTNYRVFKVIGVGAAGSRAFTVREEWNSANPVSISGGGTGGKTVAEALTNLGLGDAATKNVGTTP